MFVFKAVTYLNKVGKHRNYQKPCQCQCNSGPLRFYMGQRLALQKEDVLGLTAVNEQAALSQEKGKKIEM